jgi:hypothetical protein
MSENGAANQAAEVKDTATTEAGHVAGVAKDEAANVAGVAKEEAGHVAGVAKGEASRVAREAGAQARDLFAKTQSELKDQAGVQQERVAAGLHTLSDELGRMASSQDTPGVASDLVGQAASRVGGVAEWLEGRDAGSLLTEVKSFARRRPGAFIAAAGIAGVLAGRLTRSLASGGDDSSPSATTADTAAVPTPAPGFVETGYVEPGFEATPAPVVPAPVVPASATAEETPLYTERVNTLGNEGFRP